MMRRKTLKQILMSLLGGILFMSACAPSVTVTPVLVTQATTATPTPIPTINTLIPTATLTASITPLPTIPTFTPTFDVRTIATATSAPKAECPKENLILIPDLNTFFSDKLWVLKDQALLNFLNEGGTPQTVITAFLRELKWFHPNMILQKDVTGDGIAELILSDNYVVYVFGCKDQQYQPLLSATDDPAWMQEIQFKIVKDMNLNGIPEIITTEYGGHTYTSIKVSIFEWNGSDFSPLIQGESYGDNKYFPYADSSVPAHATMYDTDGNGTLELVLVNDVPRPIASLYSYLIPWRNETDIYGWNGNHYVLNRVEFPSPEFRFQALQDADREVGYGNFGKALLLYQDVIYNEKLRPFSHEILENEIFKSFALDGDQPVPTAVAPDPSEYPGHIC